MVRTQAVWQLHPDTLPWPDASAVFHTTGAPTPPADVIWEWASAPLDGLETSSEPHPWPAYLGGADA